jgi:hypothetical protein
MSGSLEERSMVRQELETACELLIDPSLENLDRCSDVLARAASYLVAGKPPALEARSLRASVHRVARLLETAMKHHRDWQRIWRAMTASGYTAAGDLAAPPAPGSVFIRG